MCKGRWELLYQIRNHKKWFCQYCGYTYHRQNCWRVRQHTACTSVQTQVGSEELWQGEASDHKGYSSYSQSQTLVHYITPCFIIAKVEVLLLQLLPTRPIANDDNTQTLHKSYAQKSKSRVVQEMTVNLINNYYDGHNIWFVSVVTQNAIPIGLEQQVS